MKTFKIIVLGCVLGLLFSCSSNPSDSNSKTISELSIGDKVVDPTWSWEFRHGWGYTSYGDKEVTEPVVWIVVAKDHNQPNSITLISDNLLGYFIYDATMQPSGILAGHNHWGNSGKNGSAGIRPWLNSTAPHENEGFYHSFSSSFKSILLLSNVENKDYESGAPYSTQDYVYLPSHTELGATDHEGTYEIGTAFDYFVGADYIRLRAKIMGYPWEDDYWSRSPYSAGYRPVGLVSTSGYYVSAWADANNKGVRAVVNVSSSAKISKEANDNGIYEFKYD